MEEESYGRWSKLEVQFVRARSRKSHRGTGAFMRWWVFVIGASWDPARSLVLSNHSICKSPRLPQPRLFLSLLPRPPRRHGVLRSTCEPFSFMDHHQRWLNRRAQTLTDLNDFITPSQVCIKPVEQTNKLDPHDPGAAAVGPN